MSLSKAIEDVKAFHKAGDVPIHTKAKLPAKTRRKLRQDLITEEYKEYLAAEKENNIVAIADALADMAYVIVGCAIEYGIPLDDVWDEVHFSNMTKVDKATGKIKRRTDGKILKPKDWKPPNIESALNNYNNYTESFADISPCGTYRYSLSRRWSQKGKILTWCMLNPSTADSSVDDPTIRKCVGFSKRLGYSGIKVVNLFALRATNPKELKRHEDPVGPWNIDVLNNLKGDVVVAWGGSLPKISETQRVKATVFFSGTCDELLCLGRTQSGEPRHPLMLSYKTKLENYQY